MKTFLFYLVLIGVGFGVGTFAKLQWQKYQEEKIIEEKIGSLEFRELTAEEETQYRRSHNAALDLIAQNKKMAALQEIQKMLDLAPHRAEPHVLYAETALEQLRWARGYNVTSGDLAYVNKMEGHVRRAAHLDPENYDVMRLHMHYKDWLGLTARHFGQEEKAQSNLEDALMILEELQERFSDDAEKKSRLRLEKISLLFHLNKYDQALALLENAEQDENLKHMIEQIYFNKALVYVEQEKNDLASKNFDLALSTGKGPVPLILLHRARFYEKLGYLSLAIDDYALLLEAEPGNKTLQKKLIDLRSQENISKETSP